MPLTDTAVRNAKGQEKSRKLSDGGGLRPQAGQTDPAEGAISIIPAKRKRQLSAQRIVWAMPRVPE